MAESALRAVAVCAVLSLGGATHPVLRAQSSAPAPSIQISQSGHAAYEASLAASESGFVAAWYDTRDGNPEIYVRALDARGHPSGPERRLTNDSRFSYEADVALLGDDVVVAWYDRAETGPLRAQVGRWARDGTSHWVRSLSLSGHSSRNPVVRVHDETLFCAWIEEDPAGGLAVWAQWLDASGQPVTPPRRLATAGDTTWNLNATLDGEGQAWVVFDAKVDTRSEELFLVRTSGDRHEVARLTADDGFASTYPDLVMAGDRAALTWFDERDGNQEVYLFTGPSGNLQNGVDDGRYRVTDTPGESIGAYVGWNGSRVGLAWSDDHDGQHEMYFQAFEPDGSPIGTPRRLTENSTGSRIPAIVPSADGFALVWHEDVIAERGNHASGGRSEIVFMRVR
jgi:hypothetical protein